MAQSTTVNFDHIVYKLAALSIVLLNWRKFNDSLILLSGMRHKAKIT